MDHVRHPGGLCHAVGLAMWFGILVALALAYATAISYSELAKLYLAPAVPIFSLNKRSEYD